MCMWMLDGTILGAQLVVSDGATVAIDTVTSGGPRSPEITRDHQRSPEITRDHQRSPEITKDHPRPPEIH